MRKTAERKKATRWTEEEHRFFYYHSFFPFSFFCCLVSEKKTSEKAFLCMLSRYRHIANGLYVNLQGISNGTC